MESKDKQIKQRGKNEKKLFNEERKYNSYAFGNAV